MTGRQKKTELIEKALALGQQLYWLVGPMLPDELLSLDLTNTQFKSLSLLLTRGSLRMTDLASALGKNARTTTGIVDRLVARGMVVREDDGNDRRVVNCRLSDKGRELMNHISQAGEPWRNRVRSLMREMTIKELIRLIVALEEVAIHFKQVRKAIADGSQTDKQELDT